METFDFIGSNDKPALLAITSPEVLALAQADLIGLGYKVHMVDNHLSFENRFFLVNYHVVMIEETFAGANIFDNQSLRMVQNLNMAQRRHAAIFLIGQTHETLNSLQAFTQSVHATINYAEVPMMAQIIQKVVAENDLFLGTYRETQNRIFRKA